MEKVSSDLFGTKIQTELKKTVSVALTGLVQMKETEGKALAADILKRVKTLQSNVKAMEKMSSKAPEHFREKLLSRLEVLLKEPLEDERVLREVALFAEKADITEEITRLKSHLVQLADILKSKEESVGRTLDGPDAPHRLRGGLRGRARVGRAVGIAHFRAGLHPQGTVGVFCPPRRRARAPWASMRAPCATPSGSRAPRREA